MRRLAATVLAAGLLTCVTPAHAAHESACEQAVQDNARCDTVQGVGHRGRQWSENTNEDTLPAFEADEASGSWFEADAWVLADGRAVVFHDVHLARVVDPASMPPGVTGQTKITDLVTAQFRQLRTKGGQPLMTLKHLVRWSGRHHVPGMVENKYQLLNAVQVAAWIHHWHSPVSIYQTPKCLHGRLLHPEFPDYGIRTGAKYLGGCQPSVEDMANAQFAFIIGGADMLTPAYNDLAHHYGLETGNYNSGQAEVWARLVDAGVDYVLNPHPWRFARWKER